MGQYIIRLLIKRKSKRRYWVINKNVSDVCVLPMKYQTTSNSAGGI